MSKSLADIKTDFAQWYQDVIDAAELADHGPVRGTMVIRPYGYALWENIQQIVDRKIKEKGAQNAYFPLFIPESFLKKEAKHIAGFSPELAVVTYAGGKKLDEPLVVRPTSETIIYHMFAKWITSWRDLPLKINQWANVVRWEMRARLFLRTTEFLWQEGHTAHASRGEAVEMALSMQQMYKEFIEQYLAIPILAGEKPESERFAGADHTYTFEGMMQDGRALQMGTSHVLAHHFSQAFEITYQDKEGNSQSPHCTSWAITTRLIGALIMVHGDQKGLIMPPKIAPIQVVIIPIFKTQEEQEAIMAHVQVLLAALKAAHISVVVDEDDRKTPGAKFFHWEVRGVPLRIEIGPKDLAAGHAVCVSRIDKKKIVAPFSTLQAVVASFLDEIQQALFDRAQAMAQAQWYQEDDCETFGPLLNEKAGFYQTGWCGFAACEERFKHYKGTIRCTIHEKRHKLCSVCKKESVSDIVVAKAY